MNHAQERASLTGQAVKAAPFASPKSIQQPLHVINVDGSMLRLDTLAQLAGQSIPTLYRAAKRGDLVLSKRGTRCTRVRAEDARTYLASLSGNSQ